MSATLLGSQTAIHEVLIDVIGVEQRRRFEVREKALGKGLDESLWMAVLREGFQAWCVRVLPALEELDRAVVGGDELLMAEDGRLDLGDRRFELEVTGRSGWKSAARRAGMIRQ